MSESINRLLWRFFYIKTVTSTVKVACMVYLAGVAATRWTDMDWDARGTLLVAAFVAILTNLESLSDQTASKLVAGKPPIGTNGNTEHFSKSEVTTVARVTDTAITTPKPEPPKE